MILLTFNIINNQSNFKKNYSLEREEIMQITEDNVNSLLRTLEIYNVLATFFVEISLVEKLSDLLHKISAKGHEIALYNDNSSFENIESAKINAEKSIGKIIRGIREKDVTMALDQLKSLEFNYISKIENADILFPFKRLKRSTEISENKGISNIPESISPYSQLPYNDFTFQILPLSIYINMVTETMKNEDFVLIYLNSWQFTDLEKFKFEIPLFRKFNSGKKMEDKLESFLEWVNENEFACSRIKDFIF